MSTVNRLAQSISLLTQIKIYNDIDNVKVESPHEETIKGLLHELIDDVAVTNQLHTTVWGHLYTQKKKKLSHINRVYNNIILCDFITRRMHFMTTHFFHIIPIKSFLHDFFFFVNVHRILITHFSFSIDMFIFLWFSIYFESIVINQFISFRFGYLEQWK